MKMIKVRIDLTGQRFGRLTVIKQVEDHISKSGQHKSRWLCKCDCGNETTVTSQNLKKGHTKSCGCKNIDNAREMGKKYGYENGILYGHISFDRLRTHGMTNTTLFKKWNHMRGRCRNKECKNYGGRGIKVCDEWENDFMSFYNWAIANGWKENAGLTIDRIDVNGDYEPSNCRWATAKQQGRNRRDNHCITWNDETHCLVEWEEITGLPIGRRLLAGWSIEKAFTTPRMPHKINKKKVGC